MAFSHRGRPHVEENVRSGSPSATHVLWDGTRDSGVTGASPASASGAVHSSDLYGAALYAGDPDIAGRAAVRGHWAGSVVAVVSKRLGHSSMRITADTYGHPIPGVDREASDATEALVRPRATT